MLGGNIQSNPSKRKLAKPSRAHPRVGAAHRSTQELSGRALLHPLSWWRTRPADSFRKVDVAIARNILRRTAIIGEPHWHLGAIGHAPTAIGVALRTLRRDGNGFASLDVAMSAVLCIAIEGEPAATLLMSAALKRRGDDDPTCNALSDSWLTFQPTHRASTICEINARRF